MSSSRVRGSKLDGLIILQLLIGFQLYFVETWSHAHAPHHTHAPHHKRTHASTHAPLCKAHTCHTRTHVYTHTHTHTLCLCLCLSVCLSVCLSLSLSLSLTHAHTHTHSHSHTSGAFRPLDFYLHAWVRKILNIYVFFFVREEDQHSPDTLKVFKVFSPTVEEDDRL